MKRSKSPNEDRKPENRTVSWGKHFGKKFKNVPTQYLEWFVENGYRQMKARKRWAQEELNRREKKSQQTT